MLDFSVQHSPYCSEARVMYYDGVDVIKINPFVYCGYYIPQLPTSSTNTVILEFFTDGVISRRGFQLKYEAVNSSALENVPHNHTIGKIEF